MLSRVEAAGIEPAGGCDSTSDAASVCENLATTCVAPALHNGDMNSLSLSSIDAKLQEVIKAWSEIPDSIRQAILILARSSLR